jgi:uncharacterized heparinase superfamily protein
MSKKLSTHSLDVPSPAPLWQNLNRKIRLAWQTTPFYNLTLMGKAPHLLSIVPTDPWPGDVNHGRLLLDGKMITESVTLDLADLWKNKKLKKSCQRFVHGFSWIRDLRAVGDNSARRLTRQLIQNWIQENQNWRSIAWRPEILGVRLANWIGLYDFFCASADDSFRTLFMKSIARQARHLWRNWPDASTFLERLEALKGLIFATVTLSEKRSRLPRILTKLETEIQSQVLPDGGHISRQACAQLTMLRDLIDIRALLKNISYDIPETIQQTIDKMAPIVRLFRHGDGELSTFGQSTSPMPAVIDMVLSLADVRGKPPSRAEVMGYERCVAKNGLILINTGGYLPNCTIAHQEDKGTGILNFEWSVGRERLVLQGDVVLRSVTGDVITADLKPSKGQIQVGRKTQDGHTLINTSFEKKKFTHNRQFYLAANSGDFRAEDILETTMDCLYAVRFILRPGLTAHMAPNGKSILLKTSSGQNWRFIASGYDELICDPLFDQPDTKVILLIGELPENTSKKLRWTFKNDDF